MMTTAEDRVRTRVLRLFASYARADQHGVQELLEGVERLGHDVWVDGKLSGGQAWWGEILAHIRACDAMLIAVSPALLGSQASALEREYGQSLGKPLLPVIIASIQPSLLPPDLAPLQFVDYTSPRPMSAFELANALALLPAPAPLPDPLPNPPPVPISYLSDLTSRVHAPTLTLDEQLALVAQLRTALDRPEERKPGLELLQALQRRQDLYYAAAHDIERVMPREASNTGPNKEPGGAAGVEREESGESASESFLTIAPAGWYPDPSSRYTLRWFDTDWTSWVSDRGAVIDDPVW